MKKLFLLLFVFCASLLAGEPFLVSKLKGRASTAKYTTVFVDGGHSKKFEEIQKEGFVPAKTLNFGSTNSAVWTKNEIYNDTADKKTLTLTNHLAAIDEIDVWVLKEGHTTTRVLGDHRAQELRDIRFRASSFSITLEPNERATLFIRHYSPMGSMITEWEAMEAPDFSSFVLADTLFWGLFIGSSLALLVYNISLFAAVRERFYLCYAGMVSVLLLYQLTISGVLHSIDFPLLLSSYGYVYGLLTAVMMLLFAHSFFEVGSRYKRLSYAIYGVCALLLGSIAISFLMSAMGKNPMPLVKGAALLSLLFSEFVALYILKKRLIGSALFFLGQSSIVIAHIWQVLSRFSGFGSVQEQVYAVAFCSFLDMLFLSVAISRRIKVVEEERLEAQKLLTIQTRYAAIGQTAANIAHQWRQPVARVGTLATAFESLLARESKDVSQRLSPLLAGLKKEIGFMETTMQQMESGYKAATKNEEFAVLDSIERVLELLQAKSEIIGASIDVSCKEPLAVCADKNSFENVLMILADNALDALSNTETQNKKIWIEARETDDELEISVTDNGGGAQEDILGVIFDPFFTTKKEGKGIGLPIAKMLVEKNLNGRLDIKNSADGVRCAVRMPKDKSIAKSN